MSYSKIPSFTLPSDPSKEMQLRQANVRECEAYAGYDDGVEEVVATQLLEDLQCDPAKYIDPNLMTADDRRYAALWYHASTVTDPTIHVPFQCPVCGEEHNPLINYADLMRGARDITGKPEREIEHNGTRWIVRPLNGYAMAELEELRLQRDGHPPGSAEYNASAIIIERHKIVAALTPAGFDGSRDECGEQVQETILNMPQISYEQLRDQVNNAQQEMTHGLETVEEAGQLFLIVNTPCTKEAGQNVRVRFPFRVGHYIPGDLSRRLANLDKQSGHLAGR
ncbi:MAG: hypothetical protein OIF57_06650 [Marinobacterium sp.]|nr:hypothetical protein [Marinobacterium sp.]